ncbi:hypothetical protein BDC45DRAFT_534324 [Circinella umbellata]|nr:hypothetical protein BDC45DRAFT_534324 [Circinella umbellata]
MVVLILNLRVSRDIKLKSIQFLFNISINEYKNLALKFHRIKPTFCDLKRVSDSSDPPMRKKYCNSIINDLKYDCEGREQHLVTRTKKKEKKNIAAFLCSIILHFTDFMYYQTVLSRKPVSTNLEIKLF